MRQKKANLALSLCAFSLIATLLSLPPSAIALNLTLISNTDRCVYDSKLQLDRCNTVYEMDLDRELIASYSPLSASFLFKTGSKPLFSASLSGLDYTLRVTNTGRKYYINISATKNPFMDVDNVFCYAGSCDYSKVWWSSSYTYRHTLNVTNQYPFTVAGGNYSQIEIPDTTVCSPTGADAELILNDTTKMRFKNLTSWNAAGNTTIIFQIAHSLAAGASDNDSYVFYCGNDYDDTPYIDVVLNASTDGRELWDVAQGAASQSKWVWSDMCGVGWNTPYGDSECSYSNNGESIKSWYKFHKVSSIRTDYTVWVNATDSSNNGGLTLTNLVTSKTVTIANLANTLTWQNMGTMSIAAGDNITFQETTSQGCYVNNIYLSTDNTNATPGFSPSGKNNVTTYILGGSAAAVEEYPTGALTLPTVISFCMNDNYLFYRSLAANGSGTFEYETWCPYGCSNATYTAFGNAGCKEGSYIEPLISFAFIILIAILVKGVQR